MDDQTERGLDLTRALIDTVRRTRGARWIVLKPPFEGSVQGLFLAKYIPFMQVVRLVMKVAAVGEHLPKTCQGG